MPKGVSQQCVKENNLLLPVNKDNEILTHFYGIKLHDFATI